MLVEKPRHIAKKSNDENENKLIDQLTTVTAKSI